MLFKVRLKLQAVTHDWFIFIFHIKKKKDSMSFHWLIECVGNE